MNILDLERSFLSKYAPNATAQTPLNELRKVAYSIYIGNTNPGATLKELELNFLRKIIVDNSQVPTQYVSWQEAAQALGFEANSQTPRLLSIAT